MSTNPRTTDPNSREILMIKLEVEKHRSAKYLRKWSSDRTVVKGLYLKLRILKEDMSPMRFEHSMPERVCGVFKMDTIDDLKNTIHEESVWSMHFFNLWKNERRRRQQLEQEIQLLTA